MKRLLSGLLLLVCLVAARPALATAPPTPPTPPDEGMWLPMFISRNFTEMQKLGLKLTPEQIYSINNSSIKDAVISFGGFCTGEIISDQGLILTNHHCGYEAIQQLSTTEKNYLANGFWAKSPTEELPAEGLTVSFLVRMEDVTEKVNAKLAESLGSSPVAEEVRAAAVETITAEMAAEASEDGKYEVEVKDFFFGAEFYMFVYAVYSDIRLVGTPPESIGKFGGDTDNWMWPRHTGDFSMFRVYAAPDGSPAEYSTNNVPYKPKHFLPVSLKGVAPGDYAMIMGYPGSTERYMTAAGVEQAYNESNPAVVKVRDIKLKIMDAAMKSDPAIRLQYAAKYSQISNYWKYFIGQNRGLKRMNTIGNKKAQEQAFMDWVNADPARKAKYGNAIGQIAEAYKKWQPFNLPFLYLNEAGLGSDIMIAGLRNYRLYAYYNMAEVVDAKQVETRVNAIRDFAKGHYKDIHLPTDQKLFAATLKVYKSDIAPEMLPDIFKNVIDKKYKGDIDKFAADVFKKSYLATPERLEAFLKKPSKKAMESDLGFMTFKSLINQYLTVLQAANAEFENAKNAASRLYVQGLREMNPDKVFYPDANFTMRLTYGSVEPYNPMDGVAYDYYTTLKGIAEKEDPKNDEFIVPKKLLDLYAAKDYGQYANSKGELPVCFITTNDITGGNSGSPVMNANGELIGCAFDGNWESMQGDIDFDPSVNRTICVDIRYVLFVVDKFAGATNIINELKLVK